LLGAEWDQCVFLTFDDGPDPGVTPRVLDVLESEGARATFFVVGSRAVVASGQEALQRAVQHGHCIGNHTFSHPDLTRCSNAVVRREILATHEIIERFQPVGRLFRPPYGRLDWRIAGIVRELGYHLALWDNDPRDWAETSQPCGWVERAVSAVREHGARFIVCHDVHRSTADNLSALVRALRIEGYSFSSLAETQTATDSTPQALVGLTPTTSDSSRR
jgi:peptidoglycan/xylan/chitin deacetylase (PgdA/CDA1 family)